MTIELITSVAVAGVDTVTINNIPTNYTHLTIKCSSADTQGRRILLRLNGNSSNTYRSFFKYWPSTSPQGESLFSRNYAFFGNDGNNGNVYDAWILDYAATNKKTRGWAHSTEFDDMTWCAFEWQNNAAVTSLTLFNSESGRNFNTGSTIEIYGVK